MPSSTYLFFKIGGKIQNPSKQSVEFQILFSLLTIWFKKKCLRSLPLSLTKQSNYRTQCFSFHISAKFLSPSVFLVLHLCGLSRILGAGIYVSRLNLFLAESLPICHPIIINKYFNVRPEAPGWSFGNYACVSSS